MFKNLLFFTTGALLAMFGGFISNGIDAKEDATKLGKVEVEELVVNGTDGKVRVRINDIGIFIEDPHQNTTLSINSEMLLMQRHRSRLFLATRYLQEANWAHFRAESPQGAFEVWTSERGHRHGKVSAGGDHGWNQEWIDEATKQRKAAQDVIDLSDLHRLTIGTMEEMLQKMVDDGKISSERMQNELKEAREREARNK